MHQIIKYLFYLLITVSLILFGMEAGINTLLNHPKYIPGFMLPVFKDYYYHFDRRMIQVMPETACYNPNLFYTLKPGKFEFSNREFSNQYKINSAGIRDEEKNLLYPKILFIGDSFTMGWGVEQNESFPKLVETTTGKKSLNTGVSSYGTAREVLISKPYISDSLEVVVVQYCNNDYEENKQFIANDYQLKISSKERYEEEINHQRQITGYYFLKHLKGFSYFIKHRLKMKITGQKPLKNNLETDAGEVFIETLLQLPVSEKVHFIVFSLDVNKTKPFFYNQLSELIVRSNLSNWHLLNFSDKLHSKHIYKLDGHINAAGHRVVADELSKKIEEILLQLHAGATN